MLFIGDYLSIPKGELLDNLNRKCNLVVFNFSSFVEGVPQLTNLLPHGLDTSTEEQFDETYFSYIFVNDFAFIDMMYIIMEIYKGNHIYLIINKTPFYDRLIESFVEILKQRYGIIPYFINDVTDYEAILQHDDQTTFSTQGLINADIDRQRFLTLLYAHGIIKEEEYSEWE